MRLPGGPLLGVQLPRNNVQHHDPEIVIMTTMNLYRLMQLHGRPNTRLRKSISNGRELVGGMV